MWGSAQPLCQALPNADLHDQGKFDPGSRAAVMSETPGHPGNCLSAQPSGLLWHREGLQCNRGLLGPLAPWWGRGLRPALYPSVAPVQWLRDSRAHASAGGGIQEQGHTNKLSGCRHMSADRESGAKFYTLHSSRLKEMDGAALLDQLTRARSPAVGICVVLAA